jgi:aryl-alcohol dehydrogenase-like predicted oxidoreductase
MIPTAHIAGVDKSASTIVLGTMVTEYEETIELGLQIFDAYFAEGGTTFDTAHKYGEGLCDAALGRWMETRGVRDRCVVIGKGAHTPHCNPDDLTRQLHESLERLRTDHLDVYLLHRDNLDIPVAELVDVLDGHHRAGRMHAVGGSNWTAARIDEANEYARANGRVEMTVVSNQLSLAKMLRPTFEGTVGANEPEFLRWLAERDITNIAWSSQAAGFFAGLTPDGPLAHAWFDDDNLERRRRAEQLASELGVAPVTVALAWVLAHPLRILPVIGPRQLRELETSLDALDIALTPEQHAWLDLC